MKARLLMGALAATLLMSGAAYAASPAEKCSQLTTQWNEVSPAHKTNAKFSAAEKDALAGIQACHAKKDTDGIRDLTKALDMLGVKPKV
jgi:hypothetical protein